MRLEDVFKESKGVSPDNVGDDEARFLFAARAVRLMFDDAEKRRLKSARRYSAEAIKWFNKVACDQPFSFQKLTDKDQPGEILHRETFFRKAVRTVMDEVIAGAVARDRGTWQFIAELRDAADQQLAEYVLQPMTADSEFFSANSIQDIFEQLRNTRSFRDLLKVPEFQKFCDEGRPISEDERRLQQSGRIARELCS